MDSKDNFGVDAKTMVELDLSPIRARFGNWLVTDYGIECLDHYYPFEWDRIDEDWHEHMSMKGWVDIFDFDRALNYARGHRELSEADPGKGEPSPGRIVELERAIAHMSWRIAALEAKS